jgi:hypothetical protein
MDCTDIELGTKISRQQKDVHGVIENVPVSILLLNATHGMLDVKGYGKSNSGVQSWVILNVEQNMKC